MKSVLIKIMAIIGLFLSFVSYTNADTYDATTGQLTIPSVLVGTTTYANVVVTVTGVVSVGSGVPLGTVDTYDALTNQLTIPSVLVSGTTYTNVVITVGSIISIGGNSAAPGGVTGAGILLVDAPVQGISYTSGNTTATTGADGSFTYEVGNTVTFMLGDIVLGTVTPSSSTTAIITPVELVTGAVDTTNTTAQQVAVLLQTLDSDSNPANGIQIDVATVQAATGQLVDFTNPASVNAVLNAIAPGVTIVSEAQATINMNSARQAASAGYYTGNWSGTCVLASGNEAVHGTWTGDFSASGVVSATGIELTPAAAGLNGFPTFAISGSRTPAGIFGATSPGTTGAMATTWSGVATLDGTVSGTWSRPAFNSPTVIHPACSGTFSGVKSVNVVATFAGAYQGSFSGTDSGSWSASVDSAGNITGAGTSALVGPFTIAGTVTNNGNATMAQNQGNVSTGAVFNGIFNAYGGVSGSWSDTGVSSGSFSGFRN